MNRLALFSILLTAVLAVVIPHNGAAVVSESVKNTIQADWPAIIHKIKQSTNGNLSSVDQYSISVFANSSILKDLSISLYSNQSVIPIVVNGSIVNNTGPDLPPQCPPNTSWNGTQCVEPEPIPIEVCGDGIDNDNDGLVDEGCPIIPPPSPDQPPVNVNESKFLRIAVVGDIDANSGLTTQLNLMNKYHVKVLIVPGDYGYKNCQDSINQIKAAGFTKDNAAIDQGNHDCSAATNSFNGFTKTYGTVNLPGIADKVGIFLIDANIDFGCSSTQFAAMKDQISSSDAWYNIAVVHQPFVTVKSDHGPNGQFACWDPLFRGNGVDTVLQAHNHNYQRFDINGINYLVAGTGTHDTGSSMYPLNSDNFNGNKCLKCITGTNGITLLDFQIDDPHVRNMQGWFISNSEQVKDKFN